MIVFGLVSSLFDFLTFVAYQNFTFALAVIIVLVVSALGFSLLLPIGVVRARLLVCLNGLRLLSFRPAN
jgi:Cd2+/Zn2+-exporting ATPase